MKTFKVNVVRTSTSHAVITVEAECAVDAKKVALEKAGDHEFGSGDAEYEANWVAAVGEPTYILGDDQIKVEGSHTVTINEKIRDEELFEYNIIDRENFIEELYRWIGESKKESDRVLMKEDLQLLLTVPDEYIFSSISTNEYIYQGCAEFNATCEKLIALNESIV